MRQSRQRASRSCPSPVLLAAALAALLSLAATAGAEISVSRDASGRLVIRGSGPPPGAVSSARLHPIPEAEWRAAVDEQSQRHDVDPKLAHAVMQVESAYDPVVVSHQGAVGLMQLMPETARTLRVSDPYEPLENIRGGIEYLARMLDRFGHRVELALAAYNAGPGSVERYGGIPPYRETRTYVGKILHLYRGDETIRHQAPSVRTTPVSVERSPRRRGRDVEVRHDPAKGIVITTVGR